MKKVLAYKLARTNGFDFHTGGTINYRENIGKAVKPPNPDASLGVCSSGVLHACKKPNDCFEGAKIPCSVYRVSGFPVCGDEEKWGFTELKVIREITDLDKLFGWKYSEVSNPINPFKLPKITKITDEHLSLLKTWVSIRASVQNMVGGSVGDSVWASVQNMVGYTVWDMVGGSVKGPIRGSLRNLTWDLIWVSGWGSTWALVEDPVWAYIGSLFPNIKEWEYVPDASSYPYQSCVELWKQGIIPSFDGKIWRLHSGTKAEIVWEGDLEEEGG